MNPKAKTGSFQSLCMTAFSEPIQAIALLVRAKNIPHIINIPYGIPIASYADLFQTFQKAFNASSSA
jgi:hypothetical protein